MTVTTQETNEVAPVDMVTCTIDGVEITVPKGTLIIRAAEQLGIEIPRFCDHPLLSPVAACRMCLVEIEGMGKPQPACAVAVGDKMNVKTQLTSEVADKAQRGVMEFLLINHPLDCPVCDKGGECPLQNQAMTHGNGESRFEGTKRTFPKPIPVSAQILLDRERCVSCARCTRFADEIAGDPFIELLDRGAHQQVGIADNKPFDSYFSGNTVQICPVGALTSTDYRFRSRPFDLVSTPTTCEHCASGCSLRTDERRNKVMRRLAWDDPEVNEEWNCDKGRFGFQYLTHDRITHPLVRDEDGQLVAASWPEALSIAAEKLAAARGKTGVITGGRLTREDAYAYAKFARIALGSDDIDFRVRATSDEEAALLRSIVAGSGLGVTYADLEKSPMVLLAGLEPEEESPIIFLRLRKGVKAGTARVAAVSAWASPGFTKLKASVLAATPGDEATLLEALAARGSDLSDSASKVATLLTEPGAVILVGERLATSPGGISAALKLAQASGAQLAWVPRRAGERGAVDTGALAGLLPGGRSLSNPQARTEVAAVWGISADELPAEPGLTLTGMIESLISPIDEDQAPAPAEVVEASDEAESAASAEVATAESTGAAQSGDEEPRLTTLLFGGVDIEDFPHPDLLREAIEEADAIISLETRLSPIAAYADVILPVAVDTERSGSYVDWEGRIRPFQTVHKDALMMTDGRVLSMIADQLDTPIGYGDTASLRRELLELGFASGSREDAPAEAAGSAEQPEQGQAVLATWRHLVDASTLAGDEPYLAATARPVVARMSAATAAGIGAADGDLVKVSTRKGSIDAPLVVTAMPDSVVWLPTNSQGSTVYATLQVHDGAVVAIGKVG